MLAVTFTALLLLVFGLSPVDLSAQDEPEAPVVEQPTGDAEALDASESIRQAGSTLSDLGDSLVHLLPRIGVGLAVILIGALLARLFAYILRRSLHNWRRADAVAALTSIAVYLLAVGAALSVIAGDARALVGSVGLAGLALSWALQTPIESFSGWLLNSFKGYYRPGDRIAIGDVVGDVYEIDILTTTVWEIGGPDKPVQGAQPTGALITFPNGEILRSSIVNYTRDFPYVWDEVTVGIANESDLPYAARILREVAVRELGNSMAQSAAAYAELLKRRRLDSDVSLEPQSYVTPTDAWTNVTVRYLVEVRSRRRASSNLFIALSEEMNKAEHRGKIVPSLPRQQLDVLPPPEDYPPRGRSSQ
ncbi:MAG: mechanosensitive ion channel [Verrucomicrobiota bacterium JB022]|nr:mechanosensitive ion channel [Verrucomicrobiota bacterium JB022]